MAIAQSKIRIGNAQAFWGDRADAAAELLAREPELDYVTLDYLAEVSMSILALQRDRDPMAGYARDLLEVIRTLAPYWASGGKCRLITNAGGLSPRACAQACRELLEELGCRALKIGVVTGDDVTCLPLPPGEGRGEGVPEKYVTANAYLGAGSIVEALASGADIVITGRVADPSMVVGPCVHHFGWSPSDLDRLAGATVAGHLIECGTQVTGGISTDWLTLPDPTHIGFPIVEVSSDGSCVVTKPRGTGGRVTVENVKEQLVYEIGDPANYISPDVCVSFLTLEVNEAGSDRIEVRGATSKPRPDQYKVSATVRDGYRAAGTLTIIGRDAATKARRTGEIVLQRVRDAGFTLRDSIVECNGMVAYESGIFQPSRDEVLDRIQVVLRIAVEADSREAAERFSRELMPLVTAGAQGTTGYAEGRPNVRPVFRYHPFFIPRDAVTPHVELVTTRDTTSPAAKQQWSEFVTRQTKLATTQQPPTTDRRAGCSLSNATHLFDIALARSGDKGIDANVGIVARSAGTWEFLSTWLTADRVAKFFAPLALDRVERFELPNLTAMNFILRGALKRGLRTDAQGKALGQILLEMPLPKDRKA